MRLYWIVVACLLLWVIAAAAIACLVSVDAFAQEGPPVTQPIPHPPVQAPCRDMKEILQVLKEKFDEVPIWYGSTTNGVIELLTASAKTGTWTLQMCADNKCCLQISGTNGGLHES